MARPKNPKYELEHMLDVIYEYTDKTEIPILKEVCYLNNWYYPYVLELEEKHIELTYAIKYLLCKKEVVLEAGALRGIYNKTMAVFSLKQLGWRDQQEVVVNSDDKLKTMQEFLSEVKKKNGKDNNS